MMQNVYCGTLFKECGDSPVIPRGEKSWRSVETANAGIIEQKDMVYLYIRGTFEEGDGQRKSQIGLFAQSRKDFSPKGPWRAFKANPVLRIGAPGSFDGKELLDSSPVVGKDGKVYLFYSAKDTNLDYSLCGSVSDDGGHSFKKFKNNPLKRHVGVNDIIFHNDRYYLYYTDCKWNEEARRVEDQLRIYVVVSDDPETFDFSKAKAVLSPGYNKEWDSLSIGGAKVFRLAGKWWMVYQGSDKHWDFPDRFHCAVSDDLVSWMKIDNNRPLFKRGKSGAWNQGAIWQGEVRVHDDMLYLFYEAWGSEGYAPYRDVMYYEGGYSQLGLAACSIEDFLTWTQIKLSPETAIQTGFP